MTLPNPTLLTSSGATFQLTPLADGEIVPPILTIEATAAADIGDTTIPVTITAPVGVTLASTTISNGTYLFFGSGVNKQLVIVDGDQLGTTTNLAVEPIDKAITIGAEGFSYANSVPLIGLEGANLQFQRSSNEVVLLASGGWQSRAYSTANWTLSGNLYMPIDLSLSEPARQVLDALENEVYLWVERFAINGDYVAGVAMVSDASDQFTGAQFVSMSVTFMGNGAPVRDSLVAA